MELPLYLCSTRTPSLSTMLKSRVVLFLYPMENQGEIILYQPDNEVKLEVRLEEETVWLTQAQIVELFQSSKANISEHIKNIYEQEELEESATVRDFRTVRQEGKRQVVRTLTYYNLDAIISIGFRVNSKRGIQFRQWANKVLKEYLLKGYSVNQHLSNLENRMNSKFMEHEQRLNRIDSKIDFFVRTSLPPVEGISPDKRPHLQEVSRPLSDCRRHGRLSYRRLLERPRQKDVRLLQIRDTRYEHHRFAVRHLKNFSIIPPALCERRKRQVVFLNIFAWGVHDNDGHRGGMAGRHFGCVNKGDSACTFFL